MENTIVKYEEHKFILEGNLQQAVKELDFLGDEKSLLTKEPREFMAEVMDHITYLNNCICLMESKIKRLKRKFEEKA